MRNDERAAHASWATWKRNRTVAATKTPVTPVPATPAPATIPEPVINLNPESETNMSDDSYIPPVVPQTMIEVSEVTVESESEVEVEPLPPPPPVYKRISRAEDASASRLGFVIGQLSTSDVKLTAQRAYHALHIPHALIVGRVDAPVDVLGNWIFVPFEIYDATGNLILRTKLEFKKHGLVQAEFDQILLTAGDYVVTWHPKGSCSATGSEYNRYTGTLAENEIPIVDDLIRYDGGIRRLGMPQFSLLAR